LLTLAGGGVKGAMIYFVMEACKSSLLGKAELHAAALIPAAGK